MKVLPPPPWGRNLDNVCAFVTTRQGGVSKGQYSSFNLATHVGDDPALVARNRRLLVQQHNLPDLPIWLNQVHGNGVVYADDVAAGKPEESGVLPDADAIISRRANQVLAIQIADCLPVLLVGDGQIAAIHAGWRGLAGGVIAETVAKMGASDVAAWLGPSIGPCHYEVDAVVRDALATYPEHFVAAGSAHWRLDLRGVARRQLGDCGIADIVQSLDCTACEESLFSYRRDGECGRMAMLAWMIGD